MNDRQTAALAIAGFLAVAIAGILLRPLIPIDETRYVAVAWEMWLNGNYLVPTKNFELYTHKPPLLFWLINLVWSLTGVSEFAARLVGPVSAAITILLTGRLAARLWPEDPGIGSRTILALAGMLAFVAAGGLTMFDALLALATVAAMLALVLAAETMRRRHWALIGLAIGIGVLAKGPVILIHTMPAMLAVPFWSQGPSAIRWRDLGAGIGVALATGLALVAIWLVPAILTGGAEYRDAILWTQSAGRVTQSFAHARPVWFFLALLPVLLFPWLLVPALWRAGAGADWREPGLRLALVWAGTAFLLFSLISGKQVHYLVPELPAIALVVGRLSRGREGFSLTFAALAPGLLGLTLLVAATGLVPLGDAGPMLQPAIALAAAGLLLIAVCWLGCRTSGLTGGTILSLGTLLVLNLLASVTGVARSFDTRPIAAILTSDGVDGIAFVGAGYEAEFNFAGRFTTPVANPKTLEDLLEWTAAHPNGLVVGRADRKPPPWSPRETIHFRNSPYGIWDAAKAPAP